MAVTPATPDRSGGQPTSTAPRPRNPRGQGDRLRRDLLDSATELMAEHGSIDKVSVRAVAAGAGVTPTAVYRHFADHDDLLWSAVEYCFDEFLAVMVEAAERSDDPVERFRLAGRAYVSFAMEQRGKYRVMFANRVELPPRQAPVGMNAFENLIGLVAAILATKNDPRDPFFVSVQVHSWIHGIVDLCGGHREMPWPDTELLLDELGVRLGLA